MSAAWPMIVAVVNALTADAQLVAALGGAKVYNVRAPDDAAYPYITVGDGTAETESRRFNGPVFSVPIPVNIYSAFFDEMEVLAIYGHVYRILHGTTLALDEHTHTRGRVTLLGTGAADTRSTAYRAFARYTGGAAA